MIIVIVLGLVTSTTPARAEPDRLVGYGGFGSGLGGLYGSLGRQLDSNVVRTTIHGGVRIDELTIAWDFTMGFLGSRNEALHGRELMSFAFGPEVKYTFGWPNDVAQLYVRGGFQRVWWKGFDPVQRTCRQTGACTAGFYQENPDYTGFSGRVGMGIQLTPPLRRASEPYLHFALDVGYELMNLRLIRERDTGHMITASLQVAFGGGRKGRRR